MRTLRHWWQEWVIHSRNMYSMGKWGKSVKIAAKQANSVCLLLEQKQTELRGRETSLRESSTETQFSNNKTPSMEEEIKDSMIL